MLSARQGFLAVADNRGRSCRNRTAHLRDVEAMPGLRVKGKQTPVDAYVLHDLPNSRSNRL
jgi:hypothetical protein